MELKRVPKVLVGIITRNRAAQLTQCIAALGPELGNDEHVVIVDNGDTPCGVEDGGKYTVLTSEPGYTIARNALLDALTDEDYLIFLDDDQLVFPGWLRTIVSVAEQHPGCVIAGFRSFVVPPEVTDPAFIHAIEQMSRAEPAGYLEVWSTCNSLIPVAEWRRAGAPRFREEFSGLGGEDTDFFLRLKKAGVRIWTDPRLRVAETLVPERLNRKWLSERVVRVGESRAVRRFMDEGPGSRWKVVAGGLAPSLRRCRPLPRATARPSTVPSRPRPGP